ncbi:hypothetical protein K435DRAFT_941039 [Dendrothele bispora CBS 962.96]|uniref:Transcriptional regulator of RNA polII, SAGA, subunit n=1 Tax=Dendrothele bispora (strain CBS 962.96) TaxID=1314807 RepID=A0A4S8M9R2_DENBC|nr:hypothetical protein K435DRAFT_941039 [Dendrothele bispora CBS 962.96]
MSLSSTSVIKTQINNHLGHKAATYFDCLHSFVTGKISRTEFDDTLKPILDAPNLIQLHNALIISLFDARSHKRPITPPPDLPKPPPRKRRRTLPYQGPDMSDEDMTLRSSRLKRWTVSLGKHERERIRTLPEVPPPNDPINTDEIARERGVVLLRENADPPGSRLPVQLASVTRAPTIQHIVDRINLICAQNSLKQPTRAVSTLMQLACEVKLKQLITHALTLTTDSLAISSVSRSQSNQPAHHHSQKILSTAAFETLFTISPADLPNKSAAAMRLALGDREDEDEDRDIPLLQDQDLYDRRRQIIALLGERSSVKEILRGVR